MASFDSLYHQLQRSVGPFVAGRPEGHYWGDSTGGTSPWFWYATPPPLTCPPGPFSCQGSTATGHIYGGAEGSRNFFFIPPAHFVHFAPQQYP